MGNIVLIFVFLIAGWLAKRFKLLNNQSAIFMNKIVIFVSLPALTLYHIPQIEIDSSLIYPIITPWIGILFSFILFGTLGKVLGWSRAITGAVILMAGFGNTSFIGIPVIQALYGESGIKTVVMVDQPGSFVALSTAGLAIAGMYSEGKSTIKSIVLKIVKFPPFTAFVIGWIINLTNSALPTNLNQVIYYLSLSVVPLALISVGIQLEFKRKIAFKLQLILGLFYKLILTPLIIMILFAVVLNQRGEVIEISILEAAMAPMITAGIVASSYGLSPKFSSMMLAYGIPISFITLAIWNQIIQF